MPTQQIIGLVKDINEDDDPSLFGLPRCVILQVAAVNYDTIEQKMTAVTFKNGMEVIHGDDHDVFIAHCSLVYDIPGEPDIRGMSFDAVIVDEAAHLNMDAIKVAVEAMEAAEVPPPIWMKVIHDT
jgi:hypothetical protein